VEVTAEVTAEVSAEVTAEVSAEVTAEVSAEVTAEVSAEVTVEVSAEVSSEVSAEVTVELSAEVTVELSSETSAWVVLFCFPLSSYIIPIGKYIPPDCLYALTLFMVIYITNILILSLLSFMVVCTLLRAHFTQFRIEDAQYATPSSLIPAGKSWRFKQKFLTQ